MFRIGIGFDAHRFAPKRRLLLGGFEIPHDQGLLGHSDADVLLHALSDALLGAAGLGDLGSIFPDSDPQWKDAPSRVFVEQILLMLNQQGWSVVNLDLTVIAQVPKIAPHRAAIKSSIASLLKLPEDQVSVKATTSDGMGFTGRKEGIAAQAVALISREDSHESTT